MQVVDHDQGRRFERAKGPRNLIEDTKAFLVGRTAGRIGIAQRLGGNGEPVIRIASKKNFSAAKRAKDYPIRYIVIHTTQGQYSGTINWFQNPKARVSAHYVVRSSDGKVTQMVLEKDIAWHAGSRTYNQQGIGIEHEGFVDDASWYTDAMYKSSAAVTRALCLKYKIPMDRKHIIGHYEIPRQRSGHTDPGRLWDWNRYMREVNPTPRRTRRLRRRAHAMQKLTALPVTQRQRN